MADGSEKECVAVAKGIEETTAVETCCAVTAAEIGAGNTSSSYQSNMARQAELSIDGFSKLKEYVLQAGSNSYRTVTKQPWMYIYIWYTALSSYDSIEIHD